MLQSQDPAPARQARSPMPLSDLDFLLTAQLVVAWAGEGGTPGGSQRLGWWTSDLVSEDAGADLLQRLMPKTWEWAALQAVREAACRHDATMRDQVDVADRLISLYSLGFEIDERVEERLMDLKRSGAKPREALSGLTAITEAWDHAAFAAWLAGHGDGDYTEMPVGRRLKGAPPAALDQTTRRLLAALAPLHTSYPLPHFRRPA